MKRYQLRRENKIKQLKLELKEARTAHENCANWSAELQKATDKLTVTIDELRGMKSKLASSENAEKISQKTIAKLETKVSMLEGAEQNASKALNDLARLTQKAKTLAEKVDEISES